MSVEFEDQGKPADEIVLDILDVFIEQGTEKERGWARTTRTILLRRFNQERSESGSESGYETEETVYDSKEKYKDYFEFWIPRTGGYRVFLVANTDYPFFRDKKRIEEDPDIIMRHNVDSYYVTVGRCSMSINKNGKLWIHAYYIYKDVPEESKLLKGKGLEMLCYLLNVVKEKNPKDVNDNTIIVLEASGGDCEKNVGNIVEYVNGIYKELVGIVDISQKIKHMMKIIQDDILNEKNYNDIVYDVSKQKTDEDKLKFLYEYICNVMQNKKLVEYYKSLSFKVVNADEPLGVRMETTFKELFLKCKK